MWNIPSKPQKHTKPLKHTKRNQWKNINWSWLLFMFYYKLLESLISNFSAPQTVELLEAFKTLLLKRFLQCGHHAFLSSQCCTCYGPFISKNMKSVNQPPPHLWEYYVRLNIKRILCQIEHKNHTYSSGDMFILVGILLNLIKYCTQNFLFWWQSLVKGITFSRQFGSIYAILYGHSRISFSICLRCETI